MTAAPSTRARTVAVVIGILLVVLLAGGAWLLLRPATGQTAGTPAAGATPGDTAAAFAAAYSSGDTPTACGYASGAAIEKLNRDGWCQQQQQWNVRHWQTGTCTLPTGEISFIYGTSSEIDGQRGFEVLLTGTSDAYKVTTFVKGSTSSPSYCAIYAPRGTAG